MASSRAEKDRTLYKSWLSPSCGDLLSLSCRPTRVTFDGASRSRGREGKSLSPPSRHESSVEQEAEQSCGQAPPQRPAVPLVSVILKRQQGVMVSDASGVAHSLRRGSELKGSTDRRAGKPDSVTVTIFSQHSAPSLPLYDPYAIRASQHTFQPINTFITHTHTFYSHPGRDQCRRTSLCVVGLCAIRGIKPSPAWRSGDKIIAQTGLGRSRRGKHVSARGRSSMSNIVVKLPQTECDSSPQPVYERFVLPSTTAKVAQTGPTLQVLGGSPPTASGFTVLCYIRSCAAKTHMGFKIRI